MNDLISIVIPIYKVERFLKKCVDSVICQTYSNLEIYLVDDGSPDNCGMMCDYYSKVDNRVKVIHKENGGLSDARNAAIPLCRGKYITFIDSDDFVEKTYIEKLYKAIIKYDADIAVCSFCQFYPEASKKILVGGTHEKIFGVNDAIKTMLLDKDFYTCAWGKLYKISLFENIRYPKGKLYEDLATTYLLILKSKKVVYIPEHLYWYVQRDGSILNSSFNIHNLDLLEIVEKLEHDLLKVMPENGEAINYRVVGAYMDLLRMMDAGKQNKTEKCEKLVISKMQKRVFKCLKSTYFSIPSKIQIASSVLGVGGYMRCKAIYEHIKGETHV